MGGEHRGESSSLLAEAPRASRCSRAIAGIALIACCVACSGRDSLPERLSCDGDGTPPKVWESGAIHFDFEKKLMVLTRKQKTLLGDKTWKDGQARSIHFTSVIEAQTGRRVQLDETITVRPVSLKEPIRVELVPDRGASWQLTCLGLNS